MKRFVVLLALGLSAVASAGAPPPPPWGTGESHGEDLRVTLMTFGPGDDVPSYFGHIALAVQDERLHDARLYNYGLFTFDNTMLLKFTKGRLEFWVGEDDIDWTLRMYRAMDRDITLQVLNLLPEARLQLARALADNVLPQNRNYLYNHYFDNCSTRPRDLIDRAVGGQLKTATSVPGRMTLRDHTLRYGWRDPVINLLMAFGLNDVVDKPATQAEEAFLPDEVREQLNRLTYVNAKGETVSYVERLIPYYRSKLRKPTPDTPPRYSFPMFLLGLAMSAPTLLFAWRGWRRATGVWTAMLGFILGFFGSLTLFLWFTDHLVAHHNENLFLTSPLSFGVLYLGASLARGKSQALARLTKWSAFLLGLAVLGSALKILPWFDQVNGPFIALFMTMLVGVNAACFLLRRRQTAA